MKTTLRIFFPSLKCSERLVLPPVFRRMIPVRIRLLQQRTAVPGCKRGWHEPRDVPKSQDVLGIASSALVQSSFPLLQIKDYFPFRKSCSASSEVSAPQCTPMEIRGCAQSSTIPSNWRKNCSSSVSQPTHASFSGITKLNIYFLFLSLDMDNKSKNHDFFFLPCTCSHFFSGLLIRLFLTNKFFPIAFPKIQR